MRISPSRPLRFAPSTAFPLPPTTTHIRLLRLLLSTTTTYYCCFKNIHRIFIQLLLRAWRSLKQSLSHSSQQANAHPYNREEREITPTHSHIHTTYRLRTKEGRPSGATRIRKKSAAPSFEKVRLPRRENRYSSLLSAVVRCCCGVEKISVLSITGCSNGNGRTRNPAQVGSRLSP